MSNRTFAASLTDRVLFRDCVTAMTDAVLETRDEFTAVIKTTGEREIVTISRRLDDEVLVQYPELGYPVWVDIDALQHFEICES